MDDNPDPSDNNTQLAEQACTNCKGSKKRCDKTRPSCSRCLRLSVPCTYDAQSSRRAIARLESTLDEVLARLDLLETCVLGSRNDDRVPVTTDASLQRPASPLREQESETDESPKWLFDSSLLSSQMACVLFSSMRRILQENLTTEKRIVGKFLRSVHQWLPIISPVDVLRTAENDEQLEPNAGFALLVLAMFLVVEEQPRLEEADQNTDTSVYATCKDQFTLFLASGETSLYFIQAGVLIALFEYMQDRTDHAYTTLGICARIAHIQGFHQPQHPSQISQGGNAVGQLHKTWWALVMLERYINTPVFEIPRQPAIIARGNIGTMTDVHNAHMFSTPADGFALEAEAVMVLNRVHEFMRESRTNNTLPFRQALDIDRGLTALMCKLQLQQSDLVSFRGCFATLTCASLILHMFCLCRANAMGEKSYIEISTITLQDALHGGMSVIKHMMAAISKDAVDIDSIHPFWSRTALQCELAQRAIVENAEQRCTVFVELLQILAGRWKIADGYLHLLKRPQEL